MSNRVPQKNQSSNFFCNKDSFYVVPKKENAFFMKQALNTPPTASIFPIENTWGKPPILANIDFLK